MTVEVNVHTLIERTREDVWALVSNPLQDVLWTSGLLEARMLTDGGLAPGARIERVSTFLGRRMVYTIDIVDVRDGELIDMVTSAGPFPMTVRYELEDAEGGTRMRIVTTGEPKGFFALTGPLLAGAVRRQISHDLATLRDVMESTA